MDGLTLMSPSEKRISIVSFRIGNKPEWWMPIPFFSNGNTCSTWWKKISEVSKDTNPNNHRIQSCWWSTHDYVSSKHHVLEKYFTSWLISCLCVSNLLFLSLMLFHVFHASSGIFLKQWCLLMWFNRMHYTMRNRHQFYSFCQLVPPVHALNSLRSPWSKCVWLSTTTLF